MMYFPVQLKWWKIQLTVHCEVGSLIDFESYRFKTRCKPADLGLLKILYIE